MSMSITLSARLPRPARSGVSCAYSRPLSSIERFPHAETRRLYGSRPDFPTQMLRAIASALSLGDRFDMKEHPVTAS